VVLVALVVLAICESRSKKVRNREGRGDFGSGRAGVLSILFAFMNLLFDDFRQERDSRNGRLRRQ
jgi:hypothetical protein